MDRSVDPCKDFSQFACGLFNKTTTIPDNYAAFTEMDSFQVKYRRSLADCLGSKTEEDVVPNARSKAKTYYQACIQTNARQDPALELLTHIKEVIPALPNDSTFFTNPFAYPSGGDVVAAVRNGLQFGYSLGFFSMSISDSKKIIRFGAPTFQLTVEQYHGEEHDVYVRYLSEVFYSFADRIYPGSMDRQQSVALARDIITFEQELILLWDNGKAVFTETGSLVLTLAEFTARYTVQFGLTVTSLIDVLQGVWNVTRLELLDSSSGESATLELANLRRGPAALTEFTLVEVSDPVYYAALMEKIAPLFSADNATVARTLRLFGNYIMKNILMEYMDYLPGRFPEIQQAFRAALDPLTVNRKQKRPLWDNCLSRTSTIFPETVDMMFVDDVLGKQGLDKAKIVGANVEQSFLNLLTETEWMDEETKNVSKAKLKSVRQIVGHDNRLHKDNASLVEAKFEMLKLTDSQLVNAIQIKSWKLRQNIPPTRNSMSEESRSYSYNAYFIEDTIVIPAGLASPPMVGPNYPPSYIYGGLGFITAHEFSHLFTSPDGRNSWSYLAQERYRQNIEDLVLQYNGFSMMGVPLNGTQSAEENAADNSGIIVAYGAYKLWERTLSEAEREAMEKLTLWYTGYTPEQLFCIAFAQPFCGVYDRNTISEVISTDPHSPTPLRIIGTMQNFPPFATAFKCPVRSYMNPAKKVAIW
ncbi:putative Neprilysin [Hypsibius exemplaris]|uniref:Neprilysin n=1 Tax=Hypsibius exemplaris TaxID=2072580 RepID=A0A1W0WPG2_HYPEX|nr:putative Neprilysin [Hypsibius exemplaris]